jgi:hypothetical protein
MLDIEAQHAPQSYVTRQEPSPGLGLVESCGARPLSIIKGRVDMLGLERLTVERDPPDVDSTTLSLRALAASVHR